MNPTSQPVSALRVDADDCRYPWIPDQGDGTYRNPVLHADYSDPDVVRVGDDFYLVASSFNCTPGLPILHSRDLVNWTLINHAVKNVPHPRYAEVQPGCGIWAPAIRFHAGKYWIFFPTPDEGIYVITANHPAETWSEPHLMQAGRGLIDPCPLWDDDGQAYLVHAYAGSRAGIKHRLRVCPMAPDGSRLLGEGKIVFHEPERHPTLEGPKFLKRDGWYYILAPAGGVATGWQVVLRAKQVYGPYEDKIVLAQGRTDINGPHQGALVDTPNGEWRFLHFQDAGVYGRILHLQPVVWKNGWPVMGAEPDGDGIGEPVRQHVKFGSAPTELPAAPPTTDEFDSPQLGRQWQWQANHQDTWHSLATRAAGLRLFPQGVANGDLSKAPNLLLQKFPARSFTVDTRLDFSATQAGTESGLVIMGRAHAALAVRRSAHGGQLVFRINNTDQFAVEIPLAPITLRVEIKAGGLCAFSYATNGEFHRLPELFQAREGEWIGAKVGLYSLQLAAAPGGGHADFRYFRFS